MPRPDPAKRTPLWLQRLRAKDLLQVARQFPDFPIVLETVRECLDDDLDLPRLRALLDAIQIGRRSGSSHAPGRDPLAVHLGADLPVHRGSSLRVGRAEAERPAAGRRGRRRAIRSSRCLRGDAAGDWLDPAGDRPGRESAAPPRPAAAHGGGDGRAIAAARRPDRAPSSPGRWRRSWPSSKRAAGRVSIELAGTREPTRWIPAEERELYQRGVPGRIERRRGSARHDRPPIPADARPDRPGRPDGALSDPGGRGGRAARALVRGREGRADRRGRPERANRGGPSAEIWPRCAGRPWRCGGARAWRCCPRSSPISCCAGSTSTRRRVGEGPAAVERVLEQLQGFARAGVVLGERDPAAAGQGLSAGLAGRGPRAGNLALAGGGEPAATSRGSRSSRVISRLRSRDAGAAEDLTR